MESCGFRARESTVFAADSRTGGVGLVALRRRDAGPNGVTEGQPEE
jgi:hypothetical protein